MTNSCGKYSEKQISRFIDEALSRQEREQIRQHLDDCPACRNLAAQFQKAAKTFEELVEPPDMTIDPERLYQSVQQSPEKTAGSRAGIFSAKGSAGLFRCARCWQRCRLRCCW